MEEQRPGVAVSRGFGPQCWVSDASHSAHPLSWPAAVPRRPWQRTAGAAHAAVHELC